MPTPRRHMMLSTLALGALGALGSLAALPAHAGPDDDAVARQVEAFRRAQVAADGAALTALCAAEVSYSHSDGRVEDRAKFVAGATAGRTKFLALEYRNPVVQVTGATAVVRFNWVGEQQVVADGSKVATNLHILMVWQKQGDDWKLLARSSTKL